MIIKKQRSGLGLYGDTNNSRSFIYRSRYASGFTIVELLVVIVVIAILAAITAVSYVGVSQRANIASIQSQLAANSSLLKLYNAEYGSYPTALDANYCPTTPVVDTQRCIKKLTGSTLSYVGTASSFKLVISKGDLSYKTTEAGDIVDAKITCPSGFVVVPGSITYGTSDFCVMKYEAKIQGNDNGNQTYSSMLVPESRATGTPWVNISQTNAIAEAQTACTNCHLITEAEWMTISQNVLSVASNWSDGAVGSGYAYSGHNDHNPMNSLAADSNDTNGYFGTGQSSPSNQRRTLTLTNGEVIWDLSGNVWEWTSGQTTGGQPGITGEASFNWKEYTAITAIGSLPTNILPSGLGLPLSNTWDRTKGMGIILSNAGDTTLHSFIRSGAYDNDTTAGILAVLLNYIPSQTNVSVGWRASSPGL